jgi:N-acylneuraminate cytidylyltransferase
MKLCVIPARGGSKRIPQKNIKEFFGKPIISYSIEAALKSDCFDRVIVSTDDVEIADIARLYGAEVPFLRPEELSDDLVGTLPVVKHAIEWCEKENEEVDYACCLYATAPFVQRQTLVLAFEQLLKLKAEYCLAMTSFSFPVQRAVKFSGQNRLEMFYPEHSTTRSQDLEEAYHDAGQFCWGKGNAFKGMQSILSELTTPFVLPRHIVQDIDTLEDWRRAELMFQAVKTMEELS